MSFQKLLEENLREAACFGDLNLLQQLILKGVNVNSKNGMNGWTALHWAAYRNHFTAVSLLLQAGADKTCMTNKGELPSSLTSSQQIQNLLGGEKLNVKHTSLPITPNYLKNPPMFVEIVKCTELPVCLPVANSEEELVLKLRPANSEDPDFIEIELPKSELTFEKLKEVCCEELGINPNSVMKIQKLPNTTLRKDKDIQRLKEYQELEVVFKKEEQ